MIPDLDRTARARGMLLGHLIGDALGSAYEFKSAFTGPVTYGQGVFGHAPGTGTDDTAVLRCCVRAIDADDTFQPGTYLAELSRWLDTGPLDVGAQTSRAIRYWRSHGCSIAASPEGRDAGNGALMGVAPLAFVRPGHRESAAEVLTLCTHPHLDSIWACRHFVATCGSIIDRFGLVTMPDPAFVAEMADWNPTGPTLGWCRGTLALAYRAFAAALDGQPPADALRDVVRAGGDTDTNAAVAGALLGCAYGEYPFADLLDGLNPADVATNLELAQRLAAL